MCVCMHSYSCCLLDEYVVSCRFIMKQYNNNYFSIIIIPIHFSTGNTQQPGTAAVINIPR